MINKIKNNKKTTIIDADVDADADTLSYFHH